MHILQDLSTYERMQLLLDRGWFISAWLMVRKAWSEKQTRMCVTLRSGKQSHKKSNMCIALGTHNFKLAVLNNN